MTSHCPDVSFDVLVPQSTAVHVSSDAGDISLSGRLGDVHVVDLAGDVHVTGLTSRLVTVRSGAGDVTATGLACQVVQVRSGAGNVTLALTTVPAQVLVIDQAGDIGLLLPPGNARYRVSARSPAGAVSIRVPSSPGSPHRITLTSDAGDIRIAG